VVSLKQMSVLSESFDLCPYNIRQGLTRQSARWISISRNKAKMRNYEKNCTKICERHANP